MPPPSVTTVDNPSGINVERDFLLGCLLGMFAYANWLYMTYITFNLILGSIGNALNTLLADQAFVEDQGFPGGPAAFVANIDSLVVTQISFIAYTINTWSQDALLLYRFYVIFGESLITIALPLCLFTVSVVFSCLLMGRLTTPGDLSRTQETLRFGIVFWSISIGTTIFLTLLIVIRLVIMKIRTTKALNLRTPYLSVSATLMESAFLYSVIGGIYLVFYAKGSLTQYLLIEVLGQATSIAPLLIAWRVSQRRAWTSNTLQVTTTGNIFFKGGESSTEMEISGNSTTSTAYTDATR
ncbi:hypothetical protein Clacol_005471 [Clathrus columnatus]|uniref:Uncharacterized protein n=1 Tax=Clathrus columnatus TaxID=1419009 RepID=A0AAV5ADJ0_9AGAM|nr:hypothetical protein Clacol_005471 [Clathrus columnatus]